VVRKPGPWGTGPYQLVKGFSLPEKRTDQVVLEANPDYWDKSRFPQLLRIAFDNTLSQQEAVRLMKTGQGKIDLITELNPLETLRMAQSPSAAVVKNRGVLASVFGFFNMKKSQSPWNDRQLRQAVNFAVNRAELIQYAAKGNGVIIPAIVPVKEFGYNARLTPYPYDVLKARRLLHSAGYSKGLSITLIATEDLTNQAKVIRKMLKQVDIQTNVQILDPSAYNRKTMLSFLDLPPEQQTWDIALITLFDQMNFPPIQFYNYFALDGPYDWLIEQPELRQLYHQALSHMDRKQQKRLIQQMERHTHEQAYFLFLYNPIGLYAARKTIKFIPRVDGVLIFNETSVTKPLNSRN